MPKVSVNGISIEIISNFGVAPFFKSASVVFERTSDVAKCVIELSKSAWAKSLESFGIIALGDNFSELTLFSVKIIFANCPVFSASFKLKGTIWIFFKGKSYKFPRTQYSAIEIVETFKTMSFSKKYLKYPTAFLCSGSSSLRSLIKKLVSNKTLCFITPPSSLITIRLVLHFSSCLWLF